MDQILFAETEQLNVTTIWRVRAYERVRDLGLAKCVCKRVEWWCALIFFYKIPG